MNKKASMHINITTRTWLFIVSLLVAVAAMGENTTTAGETEKQFVIVIDAGHGGNDPGACGAYSKEKDINLKVALELGRLLKTKCLDVKVVYTRNKDVFIPLQTRADIANRSKADLFISIHTNSLPKGRIAYGSETYTLGMARAAANLEVAKRENAVITYEKNYKQTYEGFDPNKAESYIIFELLQDRYMKKSVDLAQYIQQQYTANGRKDKGVHQAGFLVLRKTSMPAVLTELGFISTPDEERYLNSADGINTLARSIYNGIVKYRNATSNFVMETLPPVTPSSGNATETEHAVVPVETTDTAPRQEENTTSTNTDTSSSHAQEAKTSTNADKETQTQSPTTTTEADRPVFKVQLLVSTHQLKTTDRQFKGLSPVDFYKENGNYKYTYGASQDYAEIRKLQKSIAEKFPNTFIVAFINGQRTDLNEAIRISKTQK